MTPGAHTRDRSSSDRNSVPPRHYGPVNAVTGRAVRGRRLAQPALCLALCAAALIPTLAAPPQQTSPPSTAPTSAIAALDAYLTEYEPTLSALVADERFVQKEPYLGPYNPALNMERLLLSEMAFLRLPGDGAWLGHRRVHSVNRKAVSDVDPRALVALFGEGSDAAMDAARAIVETSSAHHLGLPRTVNVPTLPLELVHPRRRSAFDVEDAGVERGVRRLVFRERGAGAIVRFGSLGFLHTTVTVWVEPGGAVRRGDVELATPTGRPATLRVDFEWHGPLKMLVPVRMRETFVSSRGTGVGDARYSNFRRFEVAARLLPQ